MISHPQAVAYPFLACGWPFYESIIMIKRFESASLGHLEKLPFRQITVSLRK